MKRKLLALALGLAVMSFLAVPSAFATNQAATVTVNETAGAFSASVSGSHFTAMQFNLSSYTSRQVSSVTSPAREGGTGSTYYISVADTTGASVVGHSVVMALNQGTWYYSGDDSHYADTISVSTSHTTSANKMSLEVDANYTFATENADICTGINATVAEGDIFLVKAEQDFARTSNTCPGTFTYGLDKIKVTAPLNGVGAGTYTTSGVITVTDGQS